MQPIGISEHIQNISVFLFRLFLIMYEKKKSYEIKTEALEPNFGLTEKILHMFDSHILTLNNIQNTSISAWLVCSLLLFTSKE